MIKFKIAEQLSSGHKEMVEVWIEQKGEQPVFVAGIYPIENDRGISVISKHMTKVGTAQGKPPKAVIYFDVEIKGRT